METRYIRHAKFRLRDCLAAQFTRAGNILTTNVSAVKKPKTWKVTIERMRIPRADYELYPERST